PSHEDCVEDPERLEGRSPALELGDGRGLTPARGRGELIEHVGAAHRPIAGAALVSPFSPNKIQKSALPFAATSSTTLESTPGSASAIAVAATNATTDAGMGKKRREGTATVVVTS